jgi:multiple sugar transport system permease protein
MTQAMTPAVVPLMTPATARRLNFWGGVITVLTVVGAVLWAFPLYWGVITSLKPEDEVVRPQIELWPQTLTFQHYAFALTSTQIRNWYVNSVAVALGVTAITVFSAMLCGYALSQLRFPGRTVLWWLILASFMAPTSALIVNHFVLIADLGLVNTGAGIILPQLIHPVIVIVYKQFFDQVPKDFREAAVMDNASEFAILFRVYMPMNWGVTTALSIVCFIWTWNAFLWPFLAVTRTEMMTITVGITQVNDAFGVYYARQLAAAVLAGLPVALAYLLFQRRVTEAITLSAGIKG